MLNTRAQAGMYCDRCDHASWFRDGNGICRSSVPGCGEPCGCRCSVSQTNGEPERDAENLPDAAKG